MQGPAARLHEPTVCKLYWVLCKEGAPIHRVSRRIQNAHVQAARAVSQGVARKEGACHAGTNDRLHEWVVSITPDLHAQLWRKKSL